MAQLDANLAEMPDQDTIEPLPGGQYLIEITASDVEFPEAAKGRRVNVEYRVVAGPYEGRKGWDRFDIDRVAQTKNGERQIDGGRFKLLCKACGIIDHINNSDELHGIPILATASVEPAQGQYGPKNRWNGFKANGGAAAPQQSRPQPASPAQGRPAPAQNSAPSPSNAGGNKPGWMNRAGVNAR